jgi:hypothetical protein
VDPNDYLKLLGTYLKDKLKSRRFAERAGFVSNCELTEKSLWIQGPAEGWGLELVLDKEFPRPVIELEVQWAAAHGKPPPTRDLTIPNYFVRLSTKVAPHEEIGDKSFSRINSLVTPDHTGFIRVGKSSFYFPKNDNPEQMRKFLRATKKDIVGMLKAQKVLFELAKVAGAFSKEVNSPVSYWYFHHHAISTEYIPDLLSLDQRFYKAHALLMDKAEDGVLFVDSVDDSGWNLEERNHKNQTAEKYGKSSDGFSISIDLSDTRDESSGDDLHLEYIIAEKMFRLSHHTIIGARFHFGEVLGKGVDIPLLAAKAKKRLGIILSRTRDKRIQEEFEYASHKIGQTGFKLINLKLDDSTSLKEKPERVLLMTVAEGELRHELRLSTHLVHIPNMQEIDRYLGDLRKPENWKMEIPIENKERLGLPLRKLVHRGSIARLCWAMETQPYILAESQGKSSK